MNLRALMMNTQLPHGIGVGGERCDSANQFRLFIPEQDLDQCRCRAACTTFESGSLSAEAEDKVSRGEEPIFELVTAEVCGDPERERRRRRRRRRGVYNIMLF
jgi:hypothetical protein